MKIEIHEKKSEAPTFPAFYVDCSGHLWYFDDEENGLTINFRGSENDEYVPGVMPMSEALKYYEMTKVVGTITIIQE